MTSHARTTPPPHLDLAELIASAAGRPVDDRAKAHLAQCDDCQLEARRWNLVADGVRSLSASAGEPGQPGSAPPGRRRGEPGRWRHARLVAASAAAALVIVVGAGVAAGVVHIHLSGHSPSTALTDVNGCSRLQQADGTLQQVNGTSLVIQTANGSVTATTTTSTFISMAGPLLAHITNGTNVRVRGNTNHGTVQATLITVGQPITALSPPGFAPLQGTVSDVNATGFTLVTSVGPVDVTTSTNTLVVLLHASPSQLSIGTPVFALGSAGPDGTLAAKAVAAVAQLPTGNLHMNVSVKDCSANSVLEALSTVSRLTPNT